MAGVAQTTSTSATSPPPPLLDLEPELTCSICTELVYQPLTLLDCLHTFCGSCLREWFAWQAAAGRHVTSRAHPLTCPACRAAVRATRPNATVTTLLDMLLAAHPSRAKSLQEREEIARTYTPGDAVIPVERIRGRGSAGAHDGSEDTGSSRATTLGMRELQALTIQDMEVTTPVAATVLNPAHQSAQTHNTEIRQLPADHDPSAGGVARSASLLHVLRRNARASEEIKADILRQISDEGLLDGIDLDDISAVQEEQISERIAQAYRRKQREREREVRGQRRQRDLEENRDEVRGRPPRASIIGSSSTPRIDERAESEALVASREAHSGVTTSRSPRRSWTVDAASRTPSQLARPSPPAPDTTAPGTVSARPTRSTTATTPDMLQVPDEQQQRRRSPQSQTRPNQSRERRATEPAEPQRPPPSAQWHGPPYAGITIGTSTTASSQRTQPLPATIPQPQSSSQIHNQAVSFHNPQTLPNHFTWYDAPSSNSHLAALPSVKSDSRTISTSTPPSSTSSMSNPTKRTLHIGPDNLPPHRRARALWAWTPASGAGDELAFPRGAVIDDVVDVNGDWWWGRFDGREGVFPGGYCAFVDLER